MVAADMMKLLVERETAGILGVAAVDHVAERRNGLIALEPDPAQTFAVDHCDLLAGPQVLDGRCPIGGGNPKRDAAAGADVVEAEDETRPFRRAPMEKRIDAERSVRADQAGLMPFDEREAGP